MERTLKQFLAFGLIFGTHVSMAAPVGTPSEYDIQTSYRCQSNGVSVYNHTSAPGRTQRIGFGQKEYMIWPRVSAGNFEKNINVLVKDEESGKYKIAQEIDLGDAQKTTTNVSMTLKRGTEQEKPVTCKVEMEWVKKTKI